MTTPDDDFIQDFDGGEVWNEILDSKEETPDFHGVIRDYMADALREIAEQNDPRPKNDLFPEKNLEEMLKKFIKGNFPETKTDPNLPDDKSEDDNSTNDLDIYTDPLNPDHKYLVFSDDNNDFLPDEDEDDDENDEDFFQDEDDHGFFEDVDDDDNDYFQDEDELYTDDEIPTLEMIESTRDRIANGEFHLRSELGRMIMLYVPDANLPYEEANKMLDEARDIFQELIDEGAPEFQHSVSRVMFQKAVVNMLQTEGLTPLEPVNEVIAYVQNMLTGYSEDSDTIEILAAAYRLKGGICEKNGSANLSIAPQLKAAELWKSLIDVGETQSLGSYASTLASLGNSYFVLGQHEQAIDYLNRSIVSWDQNISEDSEQSRSEKVNVLGRLHDVYRHLEEYDKALTALDSAMECQKTLLDENPDSYWGGYAQLLAAKSDLLLLLKREEESLAMLEELRDQCEKAPQKTPHAENLEEFMELPESRKVAAWRETGRIFLTNNRFAEAHNIFGHSLMSLRSVLVHPELYKPSRCFIIVLALDKINTYLAERNLDSASELIVELITLIEKIMETGDHSTDAVYSQVLHRYSFILICREETDKVLPVLNKCVAHLENLVDNKGQLHLQSAYAAALAERGMFYFRTLKDSQQALQDLSRARSIFGSDLDSDDDPGDSSMYARSMHDLSSILLSLKQNDQAVKICQTVLDRLQESWGAGILSSFPQWLEALKSLVLAVETSEGFEAAFTCLNEQILKTGKFLEERISTPESDQAVTRNPELSPNLVQAGPLMLCLLDCERILFSLHLLANQGDDKTNPEGKTGLPLADVEEMIERLLACIPVPELTEAFNSRFPILVEYIALCLCSHDENERLFAMIDRFIEYFGENLKRGIASLESILPAFYDMKFRYACQIGNMEQVDAAGHEYLNRCCPQVCEGQTGEVIGFIETMINWSIYCSEARRWKKAEEITLEILPLLESMATRGIVDAGLRLGNTLYNLAGYLSQQGKQNVALNYYARSVKAYREIPQSESNPMVLGNIGDALRLSGIIRNAIGKDGARECFEQATQAYEEATRIAGSTEWISCIADCLLHLSTQFLKRGRSNINAQVLLLERILALLEQQPKELTDDSISLKLWIMSELIDQLPGSDYAVKLPEYYAKVDEEFQKNDEAVFIKSWGKFFHPKLLQFAIYCANEQYEKATAVSEMIEDFVDRILDKAPNIIPDYLLWVYRLPGIILLLEKGRYWSVRRTVRKHLAKLKKHIALRSRETEKNDDYNSEMSSLNVLEFELQTFLIYTYYKQNRYGKVQRLSRDILSRSPIGFSTRNAFTSTIPLVALQAWANNGLRRYLTTIETSRGVLNEYDKRNFCLSILEDDELTMLLCERAEAYWRRDQIELALCDCDQVCQILSAYAHKGFYFTDIIHLRALLLRARLVAASELPEVAKDDLESAAQIFKEIPPTFQAKKLAQLRADFEFLRTWIDQYGQD